MYGKCAAGRYLGDTITAGPDGWPIFSVAQRREEKRPKRSPGRLGLGGHTSSVLGVQRRAILARRYTLALGRITPLN